MFNIVTPLDDIFYKAARDGDIKTVQSCIDKKVYIHLLNERALRIASNNGHINVVELLIKNGANAQAYNSGALKLAAQNGKLNIVKYLVELKEKPAEPTAKNGESILNAIQYKRTEVVKYLTNLDSVKTNKTIINAASEHAKKYKQSDMEDIFNKLSL